MGFSRSRLVMKNTKSNKRKEAIKALNAEAQLEATQATVNTPHAPIGADEFGMSILPTPERVVLIVPISETDADCANAPEPTTEPTREEVTPATTTDAPSAVAFEAPVPVIAGTPSTVMMVTEDGLKEVPTAPAPKTEKKTKAAKTPAPTAPVVKAKITNDELQISVKEFYAKLGVPPSFRELNQQRLADVVGEVKLSEFQHNKATRDAVFMSSWMRWAISEYKKLAVKSKEVNGLLPSKTPEP
jgi:hypothetical protein